jgi:phosphomannomutase|tara:strand:+ start:3050 stop:3769 length:720 start_codon:yes stop_codon:yes gene_type:complete
LDNINYVFDVDGTMTPSRGEMDYGFAVWFQKWMRGKNVFFATGSDYPKTVEQMPTKILMNATAVHCCLGNSVWIKDDEVHKDEWMLEDGARKFLTLRLDASKFKLRTGQHFEDRPGMCNFSVVGRGASKLQRKEYYNYDLKTQERYHIASEFNNAYKASGVIAQVAGETGLDIIPVGKDKSQIAEFMIGPVVFFGDKMGTNGNDKPLADAIIDRPDSKSIAVNNWQETWEFLRSDYGIL